MEIIIGQSTPVLTVMTDITELPNAVTEGDVKNKEDSGSGRESRLRNSGSLFQKKKVLHPIYACNPYRARANYGGSYHPLSSNPQSNVSPFTQRIMSAKLLRVKQLQNQLSEAQSQLNEVLNENRILKALHKRQDNALKKYEGSQEQLPQLIKSHNEEMRVVNSKYKQLRINYRELESKLKQRDTELMNLREQHRHLLKLSKDKQLWDREKLTKKLQAMEITVKEQQEKIQLLSRKVELEGKNYRHQLSLEVMRHKETRNQLNHALSAVQNLKCTIEAREKFVSLPKKIQRQSGYPSQHSQVSLPGPPRVSIRQTPQRLVHSETALGRDGLEVTTDSTMSTVTYSGVPQDSQDEHTDDTLPHEEEMKNEKSGSSQDLNWNRREKRNYNSHIQSDFSSCEDEGKPDPPKETIFMRGFARKISTTKDDGDETEEVTFSQIFANPKQRTFLSKQLKNVGRKDKWKHSDSFTVRKSFTAESPEANNLDRNEMQAGCTEKDFSEDVKSQDFQGNFPEVKSSSDEGWGPHCFFESRDGEDGLKLDASSSDSSKLGANAEGIHNSPTDDLKEFKNRSLSPIKGEYFNTDLMKSEIAAIEEKFAELDLAADKVTRETAANIDQLVEQACKGIIDSDFSDVEAHIGTDIYNGGAWEKIKVKINSEEEMEAEAVLNELEKMLPTDSQPSGVKEVVDIELEEEKKVNLLKVLNEIDEQEKNEDVPKVSLRKSSVSHKLSHKVERLHQGKPVYNDSKSSVRDKANREDAELKKTKNDKKKKTVMKELFGGEKEITSQ